MSYTQIATTTLANNATEITFNSIPQTFGDLVISLEARGVSSDIITMRINGDTGTSYRSVGFAWDGAGSANANRSNNADALRTSVGITNLASGDWGHHQFHLFNYTASSQRKAFLMRGHSYSSTSQRMLYMTAGRWFDNGSYFIVTLRPTGTQFLAGTVATLYGVSA